MSPEPTNGRVKLTWPQVTYGLSLIVVLVGGWFSIRYEMRTLADRQADVLERMVSVETIVKANLYSKPEIDKMRTDADRAHERLETRIEALEEGKAAKQPGPYPYYKGGPRPRE